MAKRGRPKKVMGKETTRRQDGLSPSERKQMLATRYEGLVSTDRAVTKTEFMGEDDAD